MQKERLEELWPRSTSSLLLRLLADEPGYDAPIFDTGEGQLTFPVFASPVLHSLLLDVPQAFGACWEGLS